MSGNTTPSTNITPSASDVCAVEFEKKEYAIVGDAFFTRTTGEIPSWLYEAIYNTVMDINKPTYDQLSSYGMNLLNAIEQVQIAKNTYDSYINKVITDEAAFVAKFDSLNSSIANNDASIRQLLTTYATKDFAVGSAAQLITASLNNGEIGAKIGSVEAAIATKYGSLSQRIDALQATFTDNTNTLQSQANALQQLESYTGIGTYNGLPAVIANSSFYRNLNAYLAGTNYNVSGSSTLVNYVQATSTNAAKAVEAKFEYGSTITINGRSYRAGFGLYQLGTLSSDGVNYNSEFWIDASRLRFTNSNKTGSVSPFTIDATGTTPQIKFNGKVEFTNVLGTDNLVDTFDLGPSGTTVIHGDRIQTGTLTARAINTCKFFIKSPDPNNSVLIIPDGVYIKTGNVIRVKLGNLDIADPWARAASGTVC